VSDSIIGSIGQPLEYGKAQADVAEDAHINVNTLIAATKQAPIALSVISRQSDEPVDGPLHTQWSNKTDIAAVSTFMVYF
jgi:hypothetical protein